MAFGRVYVGNVDGRVYSFDRQTGQIAWTFSAGDFVYSGVAAADGPKTKPAIYFGSHDRKVYSLDAESGKPNWTAAPGGQVSGPATVIGDVVYVSTFSGNATVGFDLKTGRRVFKFDEGEYGPVVSDGKRLFLVGGSEVLGFRPVKINKYAAKKGTKGIVPPAERRRARGKGSGGGSTETKGGGKGSAKKAKGKKSKGKTKAKKSKAKKSKAKKAKGKKAKGKKAKGKRGSAAGSGKRDKQGRN